MSKKPQKITLDAGSVIRVQIKEGSDNLLPDVREGLNITVGNVTFACNLNVTGGSLIASTCFTGRGSIPVGTVIGILPHLAGAYNCTATTVADSQGFVQCNGQTISDVTSPMNGVTVPNINNNVFLAGHTTSGTTGGTNSYTISTSMLPPHTHTIDHTHSSFTSPAPSTASTATTPSNTGSTPAGTSSTDPGLTATSATSGGESADHTHPGGTTSSAGSHSHPYTRGFTCSDTVCNTVDSPAVISNSSRSPASSTTCTWNHTHGGSTDGVSANHTHDMTHTHSFSHTHTMPHTHSMPHSHDMSHTHNVSASISGLTGNGGFANAAVDNRPVYVTAKYMIRIK